MTVAARTIGTVYDAVRPAVRPVDVGLGVGVAAVLVVAAVAGIGADAPGAPYAALGLAVVVAVVVAVAVALRRHRPIAVLVALNAVAVGWYLAARPGLLVVLAPLVGCFALAARRGWRWGLAGAVPTALVQVVGIRVVLGDDQTGIVPIVVLLVATATSAGAAVGYHRAVLAATRAQLEREARTREERAGRLVAEERLRIARELHDVLGHTMATVSVQAGVALHVAEQRPEQARQALAAIKRICDDSLVDVRAILAGLRADTDTGTGDRRLDQLTDLLDSVEAAGLRVELCERGERGPLPVPVDLAAYRIVQEALTNVLRHADADHVRLTLTHEPDRLLIHVRDDGAAVTDDGGRGYGIDGMRERARALSGRLTAVPHPDGGFEVSAELPLRPDHPGADR